MRILSVVGARPQFVKLAPIAMALKDQAEHVIVHTGQHYDSMMSDSFFRELGIPDPDYNLSVGSGSHGKQTGAMLEKLEDVFKHAAPDLVLVYGDTNSTLAAAIAAVKLHIPLAHLEAGLRSFNKRMPEEHNRVLTDHAADLLLAPTSTAMQHLASEGLGGKSVLVGDVMTDVLYTVRDRINNQGATNPFDLPSRGYYVATIHRPDNTDPRQRLHQIIESMAALAKPVILVAHPRLLSAAKSHGIDLEQGNIRVSQPLAYPALVHAVQNSAGVITDSGGLQKEAFLLRIPCTTVRPETEWVETVELGWNDLVDEHLEQLMNVASRPWPLPTSESPYGTGNAAEQVVQALKSFLESESKK